MTSESIVSNRECVIQTKETRSNQLCLFNRWLPVSARKKSVASTYRWSLSFDCVTSLSNDDLMPTENPRLDHVQLSNTTGASLLSTMWTDNSQLYQTTRLSLSRHYVFLNTILLRPFLFLSLSLEDLRSCLDTVSCNVFIYENGCRNDNVFTVTFALCLCG